MMHLEIEDHCARAAVASYAMQMELFIMYLLGDNADDALPKISLARDQALNHVKNLGDEFTSMDDEVKAGRIMIDLLESTFSRLREVYEAIDDEDWTDGEAK